MIKRWTGKKQDARFRKGDRVRITSGSAVVAHHGLSCVVRRVFWAGSSCGSGAGWVCETDILSGPGRFVSVWERLLEPEVA